MCRGAGREGRGRGIAGWNVGMGVVFVWLAFGDGERGCHREWDGMCSSAVLGTENRIVCVIWSCPGVDETVLLGFGVGRVGVVGMKKAGGFEAQ